MGSRLGLGLRPGPGRRARTSGSRARPACKRLHPACGLVGEPRAEDAPAQVSDGRLAPAAKVRSQLLVRAAADGLPSPLLSQAGSERLEAECLEVGEA